MSYDALTAETIKFRGHKGDEGEAYYARPTRAGKFPGMVVIHHLPGWDEWITEVVRKFAHHGYAAISPHLYFRNGPGSPPPPPPPAGGPGTPPKGGGAGPPRGRRAGRAGGRRRQGRDRVSARP